MTFMAEISNTIQQRQSTRVRFDPNHKVSKESLMQILEATRWAPTAHNMQNFEVIVVDDKDVLKDLGEIKSRVSKIFIRENFLQLSFSEEELLRKRVGILGTNFPADWRDPAKLEEAARKSVERPLKERINSCPTLLIVIYDPGKRAPASVGDVLGFISLGCVMENIWLTAQSLGISVHILSVFSGTKVERETKKLLGIPKHMRIAFAVRLGYPVSKPVKHLRVRREVEVFAHHNRFGNNVFC